MKIIRVPFSKGSLGKGEGSEFAPEAITKLLANYHLKETGEPADFRFVDVEVDSANFAKTHDAIQKECKGLFLAVGGDHSITYSTFKAFAKQYPGAGIVVFDAHPDLMQPFDMPTHENYLRQLITEGVVDSDRVVLVGTRAIDREEWQYLKKSRINNIPMFTISREGIENVCDVVMETVRKWSAVFISVDIDVVDPSAAPGTGYAEPGGLTARQLLYFLQRLKLLDIPKSFDVVEVNPPKDVNGMTVALGAKVVNELS